MCLCEVDLSGLQECGAYIRALPVDSDDTKKAVLQPKRESKSCATVALKALENCGCTPRGSEAWY